jgi:hypothetical protein
MKEVDDGINDLQNRIYRLENSNRRLASIVTTTLVVAAATVLSGWMQTPQSGSEQVVRTRNLIIEDADGNPRIILGAPIADRSARGNPRIGMIINDTAGVERFGLGLMTNSGNMVMGFDAPVGKGDDRNRERVNIVADGEGGAAIKLKDRQTSVVAQLLLDAQNKAWLEFLDVQPKEITRRRLGLSGEQTLKEAR